MQSEIFGIFFSNAVQITGESSNYSVFCEQLGVWAVRSPGFKISVPFPFLLTGTCLKRDILAVFSERHVKAILEVQI